MSGVLRRVLVLGSGFMAGPLVECLTRDGTIAVTVGEPKISLGQVKIFLIPSSSFEVFV